MKKLFLKLDKIDYSILIVSILMMFLVLNFPFKAKPLGDHTFHNETKKIALYLKGEMAYDQVTITKAPGPILFYTPAYLLASVNADDNAYWTNAVIFTFLIVTLCMLLIYRIGTVLFSKEVGFLAVLLFFIFPIHYYYTLGILAEVPAFFGLTIALYGWVKINESRKNKTGWILLFLGLWFLILNRPNTLLVLPIGVLCMIYAYFYKKEFYKQFGIRTIVSLLSVGMFSFLSLQVAKQVTGTKSNKGQEELLYYVSHQGRFQFREEPLDLRYWESDVRPDSKDYQNWKKSSANLSKVIEETQNTYKAVYKDFLINDIIENPYWFVRQFFVKCFYGHIYIINSVSATEFKLGPLKGKVGYISFIILVNLVNLLIITGFIIFLIKEKNLLKYWLFWSIIIALLIFHGLTYMEPRYLFPSRVALYVMSAAGLYRVKIIQKIIFKLVNKLT
jgi:4-amino-4-deoxy-L-arabinose transferase-like glycosyltransferase